jgi:hypothetical protein
MLYQFYASRQTSHVYEPTHPLPKLLDRKILLLFVVFFQDLYYYFPGAAIEISDVKCTDLICIRTLPVVHVQLFRTVHSIFVNSFRDLRIKKNNKL